MNDQHTNLQQIELSDRAATVLGASTEYIHGNINNSISFLVAHYRGGQLTHDVMLGKIAEMSALMSLLDSIHADMRGGDAARTREYGDATTPPQQTTPGTRSRPKST